MPQGLVEDQDNLAGAQCFVKAAAATSGETAAICTGAVRELAGGADLRRKRRLAQSRANLENKKATVARRPQTATAMTLQMESAKPLPGPEPRHRRDSLRG